MPGTDHELTVELLRRRPAIVARLLHDALGVRVEDELVVTSETFTQIEPSSYVADLVLEGADTTLILECQGSRDARKLRSWPAYVARAHAATGKRTLLIVVALDAAVAGWAARPIATFQDGGFRPLVIGPSAIPRVTDPAAARSLPELAVLSALAHGRSDSAIEVGLAGWFAAEAVARADEDRGKLYADAVLASLTDENARALLEVVMKTEGYQYRSVFARQNFADGKAEGKAEGRVEVVRALSEALGLGWSAARAELVSRQSPEQLDRLVARLGTDRRWPDDA